MARPPAVPGGGGGGPEGPGFDGPLGTEAGPLGQSRALCPSSQQIQHCWPSDDDEFLYVFKK